MLTTLFSKTRRLVDFDGCRSNNFTIIRIFLAWLVLLGHSYPIQKLPGIRAPMTEFFQGSVWLGDLAVHGFFAISGLLVAASLARRGVLHYAVSRTLRIYPALFICVTLSVLFLGPIFSNLPVTSYLAKEETWSYFRNAAAFYPMQWRLPGLFEHHPLEAVNGSLWTLPVEVRCYFLLALLAWPCVLQKPWVGNTVILLIAILGYWDFTSMPIVGEHDAYARPAMFFIFGIVLYINRNWIPLSWFIAVLAIFLMINSFGKSYFHWVYPFCWSYVLITVAYRTPRIDLDRWPGDISYGMYIYAWPVQQVVKTMAPSLHPLFATLVASVIVVPLAFLSWRFIEKPALALKKISIGRLLCKTRRRLSGF